jgi:hypothetical protein
MSVYIENFGDNADIIREYTAPADALDGATVHLAWYGYGSYCGSSLVVFEKDGQLYEVNGSHCSCYGLEGQWDVEETSWEALSARRYWSDECDGSQAAHEALTQLVAEHVTSH